MLIRSLATRTRNGNDAWLMKSEPGPASEGMILKTCSWSWLQPTERSPKPLMPADMLMSQHFKCTDSATLGKQHHGLEYDQHIAVARAGDCGAGIGSEGRCRRCAHAR